MEEEDDRAVFDRRGRRARRHEASSDGYVIERDASNSFVVEELLAEAYESLRVGKGSGCSPPCVTRWSGGAVSHHRRIAAAAGAAKQLIMLLNLEVNITAGSLTSCPGRCFLALAVTSSCARRTAGGDVLSTRSTGIAFWWWWSSCCRAATAALLAAQCSMAAHGRSGSLTVLLGASARADGIVPAPPRRRCACFDSFASQA